jgi:hypothetical protein
MSIPWSRLSLVFHEGVYVLGVEEMALVSLLVDGYGIGGARMGLTTIRVALLKTQEQIPPPSDPAFL